MSTAQQIEDAIRSLEKTERDKLLQHLPQLFPELAVDPHWESTIRDERPRPSFSTLLDRYEADLSAEPGSYPKVAESDFDSPESWSTRFMTRVKILYPTRSRHSGSWIAADAAMISALHSIRSQNRTGRGPLLATISA